MTRTQYKLSESRTFGIEIEAFGVERSLVAAALLEAGIDCRVHGYDHTTCTYWKLVGDSSIMGVNSFELVSPPLAGVEGIRQVETVCCVLKALGVQVNKSCGLHVHHDANDLTLDHWKNLSKYYLKYEATLDTLLPVSRRMNQNSYCRALRSQFASTQDAFAVIDRATTLHELASILQTGGRYHTLNLTAFWQHGTVEVRHHSGTIEAEKILHWVSLTQCLVVRAMTHRSVSLKSTDLDAVLGTRFTDTHNLLSKATKTTQAFYTARQAALVGR